jgi:hypothetical protein
MEVPPSASGLRALLQASPLFEARNIPQAFDDERVLLTLRGEADASFRKGWVKVFLICKCWVKVADARIKACVRRRRARSSMPKRLGFFFLSVSVCVA